MKVEVAVPPKRAVEAARSPAKRELVVAFIATNVVEVRL